MSTLTPDSEEFSLNIEHADGEHLMSLFVSREVDGGTEYLIQGETWMRSVDGKPIPIATMPCFVWNAMLDLLEANTLEQAAGMLQGLAEVMRNREVQP